VYKCEKCGLVLDRDKNAAINILKVGQGLPELKACGDNASTTEQSAASIADESGTICNT